MLTWRSIHDEFICFYIILSQKIVAIANLGFGLSWHGKNVSPKLSINQSKTALLLTGPTFKITNSPGILELRAVMSSEMLLPKQRHEHWVLCKPHHHRQSEAI